MSRPKLKGNYDWSQAYGVSGTRLHIIDWKNNNGIVRLSFCGMPADGPVLNDLDDSANPMRPQWEANERGYKNNPCPECVKIVRQIEQEATFPA